LLFVNSVAPQHGDMIYARFTVVIPPYYTYIQGGPQKESHYTKLSKKSIKSTLWRQ